MTDIQWSQDFFAKGELSPLMYSRVTLQAYYQGLKRAKNVICFPQGSAGKRFGTVYLNTISGITNYTQVYFKSFQYLNECCYLVLFRGSFVDIYLEGELVATVASPILPDEVKLIDHTILENRFRVTTGIYPPMDLKRTPNADTPITGFTANSFTVTGPFAANKWFPVRFTASTIPVTSPQIHANKTYFARFISTTEFSVFTTAQDAAANINSYVISSAGLGANAIFQNIWTLSDVVFSALPQFDFQNPLNVYNNSTTSFTPTAVSGNTTMTRTAGTFNFTSNYVGGAIIGNGGIARITAVNGTNQASITVLSEHPFNNTSAIIGTNIVITEPAWSNAQGWPRICSSFQNRAFFANTDTLSNGLWGSVSNQFNNFDDLVETDDDGAISWFPTSDTVNYIQFIVPYRSLTIHTNSGVYSTPLSVETVITPQNFSLSLQDSTPADNIQPQGIDNQIIVLSGNDAHSLLWDGFNNAYSSNIISVANEQLIRSPVDEAAYIDKNRAGSRYMFIVNGDGTMAIYQSLIGENVSGFTEAEFEQSYGNAYFRSVTSNFDGRAWFVTERELATAGSPIAISGFTAITLTATAIALPTTTFTAIEFATTGMLPATSPQIELNTIYWGVGVDANTFKVYLSQADATADLNALVITSAGVNSTVTALSLVTTLLIEQLSFDSYVDCAGLYPTPLVSGATSVIAGQMRFNGQDILMQGDGFGFEDVVADGNVDFKAHGVATSVSIAQYGFPINVEITPMPISLSMTGNPKSSNLLDTKHLRYATFLFADTIGGTITQDNLTFPIQMQTLNQIIPGLPPEPVTGSFEISVFGGWNDFQKSSFTINHTEPFGMRLTGIFYKVDA